MTSSIVLALHLLSAVVWVGGMFFAYMALRPVAAAQLEPPVRLTLWAGVLGKFFPWVWLCILVLLATGYWMIFNVFGGMKTAPLYVHAMNGGFFVMLLIYMHVFFAPFRRLKQAVAKQDWPTGASKLGQIRIMVGVNTLIGLAVCAIASGGRYFTG